MDLWKCNASNLGCRTKTLPTTQEILKRWRSGLLDGSSLSQCWLYYHRIGKYLCIKKLILRYWSKCISFLWLRAQIATKMISSKNGNLSLKTRKSKNPKSWCWWGCTSIEGSRGDSFLASFSFKWHQVAWYWKILIFASIFIWSYHFLSLSLMCLLLGLLSLEVGPTLITQNEYVSMSLT